MDPYCLLILGTQKIKTRVCKNGGKKPYWSDAITMNTANG